MTWWLALILRIATASPAADADGDGFVAGVDCNDADSEAFPGSVERCNGQDDDCDGLVDDAPSPAPYGFADRDGDGFGDPLAQAAVCVPGGAFVANARDCDDAASAVWPGAAELLDGRDNDCDGVVDEDGVELATWYEDGDGDGWGGPASTVAASAPAGFTDTPGDCDDADPAIYPRADERCDGADNDCDGLVDDDPHDPPWWFLDHDHDGVAGLVPAALGCVAPPDALATSGDCDDTSPLVGPGFVEACDGLDNDCDGEIDEAGAAGEDLWFLDDDGDGFGDPAAYVISCIGPGVVADDGDCDDTRADVRPGGVETCDGEDQDCDGQVDEGALGGIWYADTDGDGWGVDADVRDDCAAPAGYVAVPGDCDDGAIDVHPGAPEYCGGVDYDCDGAVDEPSSVDAVVVPIDADGDGFGHAYAGTTSCTPGPEVPTTDCDDADGTAYPGASEVCDRADNDCDGAIDEGATDADTWYADGDGDGFGDPEQATFACAPPAGAVSDNTDCDDGDPALYPGNGGLNQFCEDRGVNPNAASCATSPSGSWWVVALAAVGLRRRSRARPT
jgi:hypothetical protein